MADLEDYEAQLIADTKRREIRAGVFAVLFVALPIVLVAFVTRAALYFAVCGVVAAAVEWMLAGVLDRGTFLTFGWAGAVVSCFVTMILIGSKWREELAKQKAAQALAELRKLRRAS